jgi:hypothetical protein
MQVFHLVTTDEDRKIIATWRRGMLLFYAGLSVLWLAIIGLSWLPDNTGAEIATTKSREHSVEASRTTQPYRARQSAEYAN